MNVWRPLIDSRSDHETIPCGVPESLRSEGCAPRRTRAASGDHSFSDCALYCERSLRITCGLAQATGLRIGRLLLSCRSSFICALGVRGLPRSLAMEY